MCQHCDARAVTFDRTCPGCVSRYIERIPKQSMRVDAFKALPPDMQDKVRAVRAAQAAALDAAAAEALSPAQRAWLTSQRVDRAGDRWKAYRRHQAAFRSQFPDATERQKQIVGHRLAELLVV